MRRSSKDAWYSINLIPKNIILVGPFVQLHSVSFWECFAYEILNQTIDQWLLHFYTKIRTKIIKTHGDLQWDAAVKRRLMEYLLSTFVHKFLTLLSQPSRPPRVLRVSIPLSLLFLTWYRNEDTRSDGNMTVFNTLSAISPHPPQKDRLVSLASCVCE